MNTGWITLNWIHIKYHIDIEMHLNLLKCVLTSMEIVIYICIGIGQRIIIYKYSNKMSINSVVMIFNIIFIWYLIHEKNMENNCRITIVILMGINDKDKLSHRSAYLCTQIYIITNWYFNAKHTIYIIYRHIWFSLFPTITICTRYITNFRKTKYFVVDAAKTYSIIAGLIGVLQTQFIKPFSTFVNYNKHRNAYEHIVIFAGVVVKIMDTYWNNIKLMKGNIIRIMWFQYGKGCRVMEQ